MIDDDTKLWVRNRSDEIAVERGCRFDVERGQAACDWMERYLWLYEGGHKPLVLGDWQHKATMCMFGWVKWSERLSRWVRRFVRASIWIPKKNGKTPTAAAWGLYLLAGDGEPGQKVFFAAADGSQARLAAKHAIEMVKASEELSAEIKINMTEMKLVHVRTISEAKPISSGDKTAAKSKQGLNGSVIIDECHVVSRSFISESSIDRAGASRDEPLHIEVSTAGKDPDGYGRAQYEYGKQVESGEVIDTSLLFISYEAPQNLTDEELEADPCKWGRMANPTWGRIIQEEEFLADYNRSKRSLADLADFKTFRLNIWQQTASPWLAASDWTKCAAEFSEQEMLGEEGYPGLDLAKTRDMTAIVVVFQWGSDKFRLLPYFFMSEAGMRRAEEKVPKLRDWARDGHIIVTPGEVTDYAFIERKFTELASKFRIERFAFDNWNAEYVTQRLEEKLGIERIDFGQGMRNFNEPTKEFERLVIAGMIEHNNNPVLNWQIGHAAVKTDDNGNQKPVKPTRDDPRKIDGIIGAIMALAIAQQGEEDANWYKPGLDRDV